MDYKIYPLSDRNEAIVWQMLRYAAHENSLEYIKAEPDLARYAANWGKAGDFGYVAQSDRHLGAAWVRQWLSEDKGYGWVSDEIPELAIAVLPNYRGLGIGTQLLTRILAKARETYSAVSLSVRANNPAVRMYERLGFVKVSGSEITNRLGEVSFNMICEFDRASAIS